MSDATDYDYGSTVTVLSCTYTAPTGKVFDSWNTESNGTGTSYAPSATFSITANKTLYAQWVDEPVYSLITNVSDIVPGAHYIIANGKGNSKNIQAMGSQGGNNRAAVTVATSSEGKIKNPAAGIYKFVISGYDDHWTIYDEVSTPSGYLYAAGANSNNYLRCEESLDNKDNGIFAISIAVSGIATITAQGSASRNDMRYNVSNDLFSCYASSASTTDYPRCYIYKKEGETQLHPYSATHYTSGTTTISGDLTINNTNPITIEDGAVVKFTGSLTSATATNLVVEDGGQLFTTSSGVKAQVKKTVAPSSKGNVWYAIASPVHNQTFAGVTGLTSETHNIYEYDEPTHYWHDYTLALGTVPAFSSFTDGRGYLFRSDYDGDLVYSGDLNYTTVNYPLTYTDAAGALKGFHLIGNPYSHDIYKGVAISNDYLEPKYCILTTAGEWLLKAESVAIPAETAILVQATDEADGKNLVITNTDAAPAKRAGNDNIWFTVKNNEFTDYACVEFKEGHGFNKMAHYNENAPMLYIKHNDESFASVDMSDDTQLINLCFKTNTLGKYTISLKAQGHFSYLHLIDRLTGDDVDMLIEDSYSFISSNNDQTDRFIVKLDYDGGNNISDNNTFVYQNGNDIIVDGSGELQIFDVTGRQVMNTTINGMESINIPNQGVYIFRLNEKVQKIVVR